MVRGLFDVQKGRSVESPYVRLFPDKTTLALGICDRHMSEYDPENNTRRIKYSLHINGSADLLVKSNSPGNYNSELWVMDAHHKYLDECHKSLLPYLYCFDGFTVFNFKSLWTPFCPWSIYFPPLNV